MLAEAVALLRRGLALVSGLPDCDWRDETELDLRLALGQALIANRDWSAPEWPNSTPGRGSSRRR
jgi:hypothetical protein